MEKSLKLPQVPVPNKRQGLFTMTMQRGTAHGTTWADALLALGTGAKRIVAGSGTAEIANMVPAAHENDVLILVAEGRFVHGRAAAEAIASAIHHRAHLMPDQLPTLHLAMAELLSNAVEHGNLNLSSDRTGMVTAEDWFSTYTRHVGELLGRTVGQIPVLIEARIKGDMLVVSIEDRGMGFNVRDVCDRAQRDDAATGRGISLVKAMLDGHLDYTNGGRRATFQLPIRPRFEKTLPNRVTIKEHGRILIVDDQPANRRAAMTALAHKGYKHIHQARSVADAHEVMRDVRPNLILLDTSMPDGDGLTFLDELQHGSRTLHIPVLLMMGKDEETSHVRGFQLGAVGYITKPLNPDELVAKVDVHLLHGE